MPNKNKKSVKRWRLRERILAVFMSFMMLFVSSVGTLAPIAFSDDISSTTADDDGDGIVNASDNCPYLANPAQDNLDDCVNYDYSNSSTTDTSTNTAGQCGTDDSGAPIYPSGSGYMSGYWVTYDSNCVASSTGAAPSTSSSCTSALIAILGDGCHDMGNAWFDGSMYNYVYNNETTSHSCTSEYITGCTNGGSTTTTPSTSTNICAYDDSPSFGAIYTNDWGNVNGVMTYYDYNCVVNGPATTWTGCEYPADCSDSTPSVSTSPTNPGGVATVCATDDSGYNIWNGSSGIVNGVNYYYDNSCGATVTTGSTTPDTATGDYCTTDYDGNSVYEYQYAYWLGGGWSYYGEDCMVTDSYTPDDTTGSTSPSYGTCTEYVEDGLTCSSCSDDGSFSCWVQSTGSYDWVETAYCEYSASNNLLRSDCWDVNGNKNSSSAWTDYSDDYNDPWYDNSWNDRYYENATCTYDETVDSQWGYSYWCETCTTSSGKVLEDSCGSSGDGGSGPDPLVIDTGYCDYWTNYEGEACTTCYDEKGRETSSECGEDTGGYSTWIQDESGQWCEVVYGPGGNEQSRECGKGGNVGSGTVPANDLRQQTSEMQRSLGWMENTLKEMSRFTKRAERIERDYEKAQMYLEEDLAWLAENGVDTSELEALMSDRQGDIEDIATIVATIDASGSAVDADYEEVSSGISKLSKSSNVTWTDLEAYWLLLRKADKWNLIRDTYDAQLQYYEMKGGFYEAKKEKTKVMERLDKAGVDIPSELDEDLEETEAWFDEFDELGGELSNAISETLEIVSNAPKYTIDSLKSDEDLAYAVRDYYDFEIMFAQQDLWWARDDMNVFGWDNYIVWGLIDELYRLESAIHSKQWVAEEVQFIRSEMVVMVSALNALNGKINKADTTKKLVEILTAAPDIYTMLDEMEAQAGDTDDRHEMDQLWKSLEKVGNYVEPRMLHIMDYVERNYNDLGLSGDEQELVDRFLDSEISRRGNECHNCGRLQEAYDRGVADALVNIVSDEFINKLVTQVTAAVMEAMAEHFEHILAERFAERVITQVENFSDNRFGDNFANTLLDNQDAVFDPLTEFENAPIPSEFREEYNELEVLNEEFFSVPVPDQALASEVAAYWINTNNTLDANPTRSELVGLVDRGEVLLARAEEDAFDNYLDVSDPDVNGYFDEDFGDNWYDESVMQGMGVYYEGYRDDNGDLTHVYGPGDSLLRAEALKMTLLAYGHSESGSGGDQWWGGWENRARDLGGISLVELDLSQPVTRSEVSRLIFEVGNMDSPPEFNGYFPDVTTGDDWAPAEALYEFGILTGDGETGNGRLFDGLNRAEMSALLQRVAGYDEDQEFLRDDLVAYVAMANERGQGGFFANLFASLGSLLRGVLVR